MNRSWAFFLVFATLFVLCSCGQKGEPSLSAPSETSSVSAQVSSQGKTENTLAPDDDTSGPEDQKEYPLVDRDNVLTPDRAEELVSWAGTGWNSRNSVCEKFGSPTDVGETSGILVYLVSDGRRILLDRDGSGDSYKVRVETSPKLFTLADFAAAFDGTSSKTEVETFCGAPADIMGSGISRDVYYTKDGKKISIRYYRDSIYEISLLEGETVTVLYTENDALPEYPGTMAEDFAPKS